MLTLCQIIIKNILYLTQIRLKELHIKENYFASAAYSHGADTLYFDVIGCHIFLKKGVSILHLIIKVDYVTD